MQFEILLFVGWLLSITMVIQLAGLTAMVEGRRIVGYPLNVYSHAVNLVQIGEEMQNRGYEYTVIISSWMQGKLKKDMLPFRSLVYQGIVEDELFNYCIRMNIKNKLNVPPECINHFADECSIVADMKEIASAIAQSDILLCDLTNICCHVMAKITGISNVVDYSSIGFSDPFFSRLHRIPNNVAYVPQFFTEFGSEMTFYERLVNFCVSYLLTMMQDFVMASAHYKVLQDHGINEKVYVDKSPAAILLVAGDFAVEFPRPITPAVKMVGPILPKPPKPLPQDFENFISSNNNGFIFVSFGSTIFALNELTDVNEIANGLGRLPYQVLWKSSGHIPLNISDNIKIIDWAPQNDVLGHPQIKAFVSHCGMNSIYEAAYHGVPVLAIPVISDGFSNAKKLVAAKMSKIIDIRRLDAETIIKETINVATTSSYRENAKRVSSILRTRPSGRSSVEEVGDWIEYALTFDNGKHLLSTEFDLYFYQRYSLDVIGFIALAVITVHFLLKIICRCLCNSCHTIKFKRD